MLKHEWIVPSPSSSTRLCDVYSTTSTPGLYSGSAAPVFSSARGWHQLDVTLMWFAFACGECLRSRSLVEATYTTTTRSRNFISSRSLTSISRGPPLRQGGCSDLQQFFRGHLGLCVGVGFTGTWPFPTCRSSVPTGGLPSLQLTFLQRAVPLCVWRVAVLDLFFLVHWDSK